MDSVERRILKALDRYGALSSTKLYQIFHRIRAKRKNDIINQLKEAGLIKQDRQWIGNSLKPTQLFSLTEKGIKQLKEMDSQKIYHF